MKYMLLAIILLTTTASADTVEYRRILSNITVIDGDTIKADFPCSDPLLCKRRYIRLLKIDTPEKGWRAGCDYERKLALEAGKHLVSIINNSLIVEAVDVDLAAFSRIEARILADGLDVGSELIRRGVARYTDYKQVEWCK